MRCEQVRGHLYDCLSRETSPLLSLRIGRHLAGCAECTAELERLRRLRSDLRTGDLFTPTPRLPRRPPMPTSLRVGAAAAAATVLALVVGVQLMRPEKSLAAQIRLALEHVQTWHLSGWRIIDGKKVPWEIWCRRSPYLYYERSGDDYMLDNGRTVLRLIPLPTPWSNSKSPLALRTPSTAKPIAFADSDAEPNWNEIMQPSLWNRLQPPYYNSARQDNGNTVTFKMRSRFAYSPGAKSTECYTVNKANGLPVTYRLTCSNDHQSSDSETLNASYNEPIPDSVVRTAPPAGWTVVDMTSLTQIKPEPGAAETPHGICVNVKTTSVSADGDILIDASVVGQFPGEVSPDGFRITDSDGKTIPYVDVLYDTMGSAVLLSPLEPPANPSRLKLNLAVEVDSVIPFTDSINPAGDSLGRFGVTVKLLNEHAPIVVPVADADAPRTPVESFGAGIKYAVTYGNTAPQALTQRRICFARARYWDDLAHQTKSIILRRSLHERCADWEVRACDALPDRPGIWDQKASALENAALDYTHAGDKKRADICWRRLVELSRKSPAMSMWGVRAQIKLGGGASPGRRH